MQPLSNDLRERILNAVEGPSQSVSLELDTAWDQIASDAGMDIQSRSQKR
jgi:hypothetical protein